MKSVFSIFSLAHAQDFPGGIFEPIGNWTMHVGKRSGAFDPSLSILFFRSNLKTTKY